MAELIGRRLAQYDIVEQLGRGGMGEVFRAHDTVLRRDVALKALPEAMESDPVLVARFDREARLLAALNHPNIATIFNVESGEAYGLGRRRFLVLELIPGEDLAQRLVRGALPVEEALRVAAQIARALEAAHKKGIVHRDLKPANVAVTPEGVVKVLDFGVAKVSAPMAEERPATVELTARGVAEPEDTAAADAAAQGLTTAGTLMGTVPYMSPEQLRGDDVDPRTDVWALACVLFECLTGVRAFGRPSLGETMVAIKAGEPNWSLLPASTPRAVHQILARCLRKEPERRLQQAQDARLAIEDALGAKPQPGRNQASVAVLPFASHSADREDAYFGDGLAEEITNALARLPGLRVASRNSAFTFRDSEPDIRRIGEQLGVATVLEGSVRRSGQRLRITVRLTQVDDGFVAWSQRYDREMADVFAIQDEITGAVVAALEPTLLGRSPRSSRTTENLEAYQLYLQGRHFWHQRTAAALKAGIECFERAARLDAGYAKAYAGIADSYAILRGHGFLSWQQGHGKAQEAATLALECDPTVTEVHLSAALVKLHYDEDWQRAEVHFKKAIEIEPRSSLAQGYYGLFLAGMQRGAEAATQAEISVDLDPLSPFIHALAGLSLYTVRGYDPALQALERALELQADYPFALTVLGLVYCKKLRFRLAVEALERLVGLSKRAPLHVGILGLAYGLDGRAAEARALREEMRRRSETEYLSPHTALLVEVGLGDRDAIFESLERCREDRTSALAISTTVGPFLGPLVREPRFAALLAALHTPPLDPSTS